MAAEPLYVGMDVSKATIDVCTSEGETWQAFNDDAAMEALRARIIALQPALVVLEATGGYEARAAGSLAAGGVPLAIVNPRQVRSYARSIGQLAKTDRIDARILARFAAAVQPEPRALPSAEANAIEALITRRRQLQGMLTAEKNRLQMAAPVTRRQIKTHIGWLRRQIAKIDEDIDGTIRRSPLWRAKDDLLRSVPGVGSKTSQTLLVLLPELGTLTPKQIAALVGGRAVQPGQRPPPRPAPHLGRTRPRAHGALHGGARGEQAEPYPQGLPRTTASGRQSAEGGDRRLHAQAAHDPQCDGARRTALGASHSVRSRQLLRFARDDSAGDYRRWRCRGSSRRRAPVRSKTALAMAAAIGTITGSPAPVEGVVSSPTITVSMAGVSLVRGTR